MSVGFRIPESRKETFTLIVEGVVCRSYFTLVCHPRVTDENLKRVGPGPGRDTKCR